MKLHPTVLVVTAVALTGLTGCGASTGGAAPDSGVAAGLGSPERTEITADRTEAAREDGDGPAEGAGQDSEGTATSTGKPGREPATSHPRKPQGPRVVSFKVVQKPKCAEGTAVFRAEAVPLVIKWRITGADSAALSVDDPTGTPGTYGPVGLTGTQEFTFACNGEVGSTETHTYAIYTVGGGPQKHKTLEVSAKVLDKGLGTD